MPPCSAGPSRFDPGDPLVLLTPAEMVRADRAAVAGGVPTARLMEAAGAAVARAVRRRFRPCRTLVLAGPGDNGGDGWVAARWLEAAGWPVAVAALAPPRPGSAAAGAAARWRGPRVAATAAEARRCGLLIDAGFGAGLTRPLAPEVAAVLAAAGGPRVAIDVPSGLDGATGAARGPVAAAALTVTFGRLKPGHLLLPGRALCGALVLADIGLPAAAIRAAGARAWQTAPALWRLPDWSAAGHKYDRGHVTVLGGAAMPGAARLAAQAAHRAGAGLVSIAAPDPATAAVCRAGDAGILVTEAAIEALLADARRTVWVVGPGLPADHGTRAALRTLIAAGRSVVADAGALGACAGDPAGLAGPAVLTPHAGEFARSFGPIGEDRPAAARAAAAATGAAVVLKGADTIVAAPDGRLVINAHAPPWLATGGTGDVLAGLIAALLAQGMDAFTGAAAAVWLHGEAGRLAGPGLVAADLPGRLPAAFEAARAGRAAR